MRAVLIATRESENITALGAVAGGCSKERMSVTTCARCGQPLYPGASICPTCGAAVMGAANFGTANPNAAFGPAPQPPAAFPGAPRNGNASFSAGSLVNSDALPDWLLQAGTGAMPAQPANGFGRGPVPAPGYNQPPQQGMYGQPPASGGLGQPRPMAPGPYPGQPAAIPAQGLFDESALPDWLRQASAGQASSGYDAAQQPTAYQPAAPNPAYGGGPARYGAPPATPMTPAYPPNGYNGYNGYPPPSPQRGGPSTALGQPQYPPTQANAFPSLDRAGASASGNPGGMPARGLVDSGALPGWLGGQTSQPQTSSGSGSLGSGGLSARSLIDDAALPQWLRAQAAPAQPAAQPHVRPPAPPVPASAWGAPATADEPLPNWLNQAYMDANVRRIEPARAPSDWLSPGQGSAPLGSGNGQMGGGLSASAFVDESALPEWLKSQGGVPAASMAQSSYAAPAATQNAPAFASYTPGAASTARAEGDAEGKFSVSDLIDPEALPSWVSGQNASSGAGWASKQSSVMSAASSTSLRAASSTMEAARTASDETGGWDEPNLPSWMRGMGADDGNQSSQAYPSAPSSRGRSDELTRDGRMDPNASSARRRGQPIPSEELPPWLRSPRAGASAPPAGGYGRQQGPRRPASQQDRWSEEQDASERWTDWDEDNFGGEYDGGMDFADDGARQEKQRGGWRRLFGRR